ncbi:hypothetical protein BKA61DRAFT_587833 [Leptodontidium sp. MPI-SDFR-AT-0119]|nr:hypothetical protein BKA61DRAFT_587833 [Leptodontidium sp. MPI-SDFR-AT-0119]
MFSVSLPKGGLAFMFGKKVLKLSLLIGLQQVRSFLLCGLQLRFLCFGISYQLRKFSVLLLLYVRECLFFVGREVSILLSPLDLGMPSLQLHLVVW